MDRVEFSPILYDKLLLLLWMFAAMDPFVLVSECHRGEVTKKKLFYKCCFKRKFLWLCNFRRQLSNARRAPKKQFLFYQNDISLEINLRGSVDNFLPVKITQWLILQFEIKIMGIFHCTRRKYSRLYNLQRSFSSSMRKLKCAGWVVESTRSIKICQRILNTWLRGNSSSWTLL